MKRVTLLIATLFLTLTSALAQPGGGWGSQISLDQSSMTMYPGGTYTFTVSQNMGWSSTTIDNSDCTWTSSNTAVATVSAGVVTAVANGSCTITCSYTSSGGGGGWGGSSSTSTASCSITVTDPPTPMPEDELPFVPTDINNGEFAAGTLWYLMTIRSSKYLYYNEESYGCITCAEGAPAEGSESTQYLWCFTGNRETGYRIHNYASGASYFFGAYDANNNTIIYALSDENATGYFYCWPTSTSDKYNLAATTNTNACLNDYGGSGTIAYWVSSSSPSDDGSAIIFQEVDPTLYGGVPSGEVIQETGVTLNTNTLTITKGNTFQLEATIEPADASYQRVSWSTSDATIAQVSNGLVTAKGIGSATITATTHGGYTATCEVTVTKPVDEDALENLGTVRYLTFTDGQVVAIPEKYIEGESEEDGIVSLTLTGDTIFSYATSHIASQDTTFTGTLPEFESFKFNNKFNDQLYDDAIGEIDSIQHTIKVQVGCIGKRLTASFKVPDESKVWVNGEQQISKKTRRRYDDDVKYTVAYDNMWIYRVHKVRDAVYSVPARKTADDAWTTTPVALSANQLTKVNSNTLQVNLLQPLKTLQFNANIAGNVKVLASHDGSQWEEVYKLRNVQGESPIIALGDEFEYLRLVSEAGISTNNFALASVMPRAISAPRRESTLLSPAEYEIDFVPFGTDYTVSVDFLTDHPTDQYNVPRIDINTFDGSMITSKDYYWDASFEIQGNGVFPDMKVDTMQIKGRGNSSWSSSSTSKNPYRLKFATKVKPFGLTKGKNWVLLANKLTGSMTTNAIAMKIADQVESAGCNHIIPCELYINGNYRGNYNFTEKVGFSNNSIDVEDETKAAMLELDSYYDEDYKFRDATYNLYTNVHEPDFSDTSIAYDFDLNTIQTRFNALTKDVKAGTYENDVDVKSVCSAMFVTDLVRNTELMHPKSWFLYTEDITADSVWVLGPVWDFDWSYGYENSSKYFVQDAQNDLFSGLSDSYYPFFQQILRGSEVVKKAYYTMWTDYIQSGKLAELIEYCDDYYNYVNPSFVHNASKWSDGNAYSSTTDNAKSWLQQRADYIYKNLDTYDISGDIDDYTPNKDYGEPDKVDVTSILTQPVDVYTLNGVRVRNHIPANEALNGLKSGIYLVGGKKVIVRQ